MSADTSPPGIGAPESLTITLGGKRIEVDYHSGDTVLETARRGGFDPPFSCQAGNCGTCMAMLREGSVSMRVNDVLTPDELEEGWILTCQSEPSGTTVIVDYDV